MVGRWYGGESKLSVWKLIFWMYFFSGVVWCGGLEGWIMVEVQSSDYPNQTIRFLLFTEMGCKLGIYIYFYAFLPKVSNVIFAFFSFWVN